MARVHQVMDMSNQGFSIKVLYDSEDKNNPYRVYRVWYGHRRLLVKYADYYSVICFLHDIYREGMDTATVSDLIEWTKRRG